MKISLFCCVCHCTGEAYRLIADWRKTNRGDFLCPQCAEQYEERVMQIEKREVKWRKM